MKPGKIFRFFVFYYIASMNVRLPGALQFCCFLFLLGASLSAARAQGCSDAGFCTMGAMKPDQPFNKKIDFRLRSMELSFYRGTTSLTPRIYVATADLNFGINRKTFFQVKLPYQAVTGRLANTSSLGDISLCLTRSVKSTARYDVNLSLGAKIPTNNSNKKNEEGLSLPMYYQTSLGTYDAIAGISVISRKWLFATGIQVPLNKNNNQFLWQDWIDENTSERDSIYIRKYDNANQLKRGTDVMLRFERNFRYSRVNFTIGILPIFRVYHDVITDVNGDRVKPDGAMGFAVSGIVTAGYNFDVRSGVKLLLGHKIVNRDFNPDGLTREFVSTLSYYYRF